MPIHTPHHVSSLARWPKVSPDAHRGTQLPPPLSSRASGCGAKRSGPKPRDPLNHHRRRRFQTNKTPLTPKNTKRTQFPYRWRLAGFSSTNYAKRTQFTVPPPSRWLHRVQKMRNEPNLNKPTSRKQPKSLRHKHLGRFRRGGLLRTPCACQASIGQMKKC